MHFKKTLLLLSLLLISVNANAGERNQLENGHVIYSYDGSEVPEKLQRDGCTAYAFSTQNFYPLPDDRYTGLTKDKHPFTIIVEHSCVYVQTGTAKLENGTEAEFYKTDLFNTTGNIVYRQTKKGFEHVNNAELQLQNGQKFSVKNGYITSPSGAAGNFNRDSSHILYDDGSEQILPDSVK